MYQNRMRTCALVCALTPLMAIAMGGSGDSGSPSSPQTPRQPNATDTSTAPQNDNFLKACCRSTGNTISEHPYAWAGGVAAVTCVGYLGYVVYNNWGHNWEYVKQTSSKARTKASQLVDNVRARWNSSNEKNA